MPKLLHTADIHLDGSFNFLGSQGVRHRQQIRSTFDRIVDLAHHDGYDLLLIAGDLFDSPHPSQATVDHVKIRLASLSIPVCILPGNHDALKPYSVFDREAFSANVHVLKHSPTYLSFPHFDLVVAGTPCTDSVASALVGLARPANVRWFVVLAHGNMETGLVNPDTRPIRRADLDALCADYVALGDWHGLQDYSGAGYKAFYPGAPEPTRRGQGNTGSVLSIALSDQGIAVTPKHVGDVHFEEKTISVANLDQSSLVDQIRTIANPKLMLTLNLTGVRRFDQEFDVDRLLETLASSFYDLNIVDKSFMSTALLTPDEYPESQVIGQFVRLCTAELAKSNSPDDRRIIEHALQLGVALLQGKNAL